MRATAGSQHWDVRDGPVPGTAQERAVALGMAPRSVRLHLRSKARLQGAIARLVGAFDGLWLGFATPRFLHALDETHYRGEPGYRDEAYNLAGLSDWESAAIDRYFPPAGRLAVTAAGGGREVIALAARGYEVDGYECHGPFVHSGNLLLAGNGLPATLSPCARDVWPGGASPVDGVIIGWGSYTLIADRAARVDLLRGARSCLAAGAPILVSFVPRSGDSAYLKAVHRVGSACRRATRRPPLLLGDALYPNFVHCFSRADIDGELRDAGFELVHFAERPYGHAVGLACG